MMMSCLDDSCMYPGLMIIHLSSIKEWYETSYHGTLEGSEELTPEQDHPQRQKAFLQNNVRLCPVNSTRNPGRYGHLYHTLEYGNFFQVLTPVHPDRWFTSKNHLPNITANTSEGVCRLV